ncbi:MAG: hypothetical protein RL434_888 [Pseudomonadota bacterium]
MRRAAVMASAGFPVGPPLSPEKADALLGAETFLAAGCVDWDGRLRSKLVHRDKLESLCREGVAMSTAIFATDVTDTPMANGLFQDPAHGYPDARLIFDAQSLCKDVSRSGETRVLLLGQLEAEYAAWCPRALLGRELSRLHALGFMARGAGELECHVLAETAETLQVKRPAALQSHPDFLRMYSHLDHLVAAPLLEQLQARAAAMGLPVRTMHAEFRGLLEVCFEPEDPLAAASHWLCFKTMAKAVGREHGALLSFMARLSEVHETAGGHLNLSLLHVGDQSPAFGYDLDAAQPNEILRCFLGGLQQYLPDFFLVFAPNLNSWKRFAGPAFVPRTNSWGLDNKTAALRVVAATPGETRIEIRIGGADVNPCLVFAAALAAGRLGITERLLPRPAAGGDAAQPGLHCAAPFPSDFAQAIVRWRGSPQVRAVFGAEFVDAYARSREWQLALFSQAVTDWEVRQFAEGV